MASVTDVTNSSNGVAAVSNQGGLNATKDQFLKLLLAQLKYQDPLQPPDASKFGEQMTQFGQLEQLFNVNDKFQSLSTQSTVDDHSQAVSFISKNVVAYGNELEISSTNPGGVGFELSSASTDVRVEIRNGSNQLVRTLNFSNQPSGVQYRAFDGLNEDGSRLGPGMYKYSVQAKDVKGVYQTQKTVMSGNVDGVDFSGGKTALRLGNRFIDLNNVISVSAS